MPNNTGQVSGIRWQISESKQPNSQFI